MKKTSEEKELEIKEMLKDIEFWRFNRPCDSCIICDRCMSLLMRKVRKLVVIMRK